MKRRFFFKKRINAFPAKFRSGKNLIAVLVAATQFLFAISLADAVSNNTKVAVGFLDAISVTENEFSAQGWVASFNSNREVVALVIQFGDTKIYEGKFAKLERPDVAAAMKSSMSWWISFTSLK
jgi:hypothetical protein